MTGPVVVPAADWRRQTWKPIARIPVPTPENWIHHSGPGAKTFGTLLGNERYHVVTLDWRALGYSWAITVDRIDNGYGRIFEGRGWGGAGGHTKGRNRVSHGILLVGNWTSATSAEIEAASRSAAWLIGDGDRRGYTRRVVSGGHRQAPGAATACPAAAGMAVVARSRQLLKTPPPDNEDDEMTPAQEAKLDAVIQDVADLTRVVRDLAGTVGAVDAKIGTGRRGGSQVTVLGDLGRVRQSQRAIGTAVGAPVDNSGPFDGSTVVS